MNLRQDIFDNFVPFRCFRSRTVLSGGQKRLVGCYHCPSCESSRMQEYSRAIQIEASQHKYVYFLTLTYSPENLPLALVQDDTIISPDTGEVLFPTRFDLKRFSVNDVIFSARQVGRYSLLPQGVEYLARPSRSDLQLFIKRLRKYVYTRFQGEKIRFFAVCEYGPKSLRPHFHVVIFSNSEDLFSSGCLVYNPKYPERFPDSVLPSLWSLGRVSSELSKGKCANYLSSYLVSSVNLPEVLQTRAFRPFVFHSQHFGFPIDYDLQSVVFSPALYDKNSRKEGCLSLGVYVSSDSDKPPVFLRYPDSFYSYLLPKLPFVHNMQRQEIYWLYCLYDSSRLFCPAFSLTRIAKIFAMVFVDDSLCALDSSSWRYFSARLRSYSDVFGSLCCPPSDINFRDEFLKSLELFFVNLLSISRRVSRFASQLGISLRTYVDMILSYYQCNEDVKLYNFYRSQEYFFNTLSRPISDLKYFYDLEFSSEEVCSGVVRAPSKVNFLLSAGFGVYDNVNKCLKMLNIEHNSKLYDNDFVKLSCISDRYFHDWQNSVIDSRKQRMKHKIQNEIMFNFFK